MTSQDRHQYAESIGQESKQKTCQYAFKIVAASVRKETAEHRSVFSEYDRYQQYRYSHTEEQQVLGYEFADIVTLEICRCLCGKISLTEHKH